MRRRGNRSRHAVSPQGRHSIFLPEGNVPDLPGQGEGWRRSGTGPEEHPARPRRAGVFPRLSVPAGGGLSITSGDDAVLYRRATVQRVDKMAPDICRVTFRSSPPLYYRAGRADVAAFVDNPDLTGWRVLSAAIRRWCAKPGKQPSWRGFRFPTSTPIPSISWTCDRPSARVKGQGRTAGKSTVYCGFWAISAGSVPPSRANPEQMDSFAATNLRLKYIEQIPSKRTHLRRRICGNNK